MPKMEEGEFELVLGNKQLLSVFFIVVVLLGVFFAMGYIAGRNTAAGTNEVATSQSIIVEAGPAAKRVPSETSVTASSKELEQTARSVPPPPVVREERRPIQKEEPQEAVPPPRTVSTSAPKAVEPPKTSTPSSIPNAAQSSDPSPGTYLQVAATTKAEGVLLLQVLSKRGFAAKLAQVPGQDMYRVVVGPVDGAQEIAKTRDDLKAAGFKPFTRKF